jgi:hypothetical protein
MNKIRNILVRWLTRDPALKQWLLESLRDAEKRRQI